MQVDGHSTSISVLSPKELEVVGGATNVSSAISLEIKNPNEMLPTASLVESDAVDLKLERSEGKNVAEPLKGFVARTSEDDQTKAEMSGKKNQEEVMSTEYPKLVETSLMPNALEPVQMPNQTIEIRELCIEGNMY